jgi:cell division protease FtsH
MERRDYSEEAAAAIDAEVSRILDEQYARAENILKEKSAKLKELSEALLEQETVDRDNFVGIMNGAGKPQDESVPAVA